MSSNPRLNPNGPPPGRSEPPIRPAFRLTLYALLAAALTGAGVYFINHRNQPIPVASPAADESAASLPEADSLPETAPLAPPPVKETTQVAVSGKVARPSNTGTASVSMPEPSAQTRQLVAALSAPEQVGRTMTPEQAATWKQNLQQLVQQGKDAVPAVAEFLRQNKDLDFGTDASHALGYGSVRRAMFDALTQIGGPEGVSATLEALRNSADPREIALMAQALDKMAPAEHREEALQAAREALAMAGSGKLDGTDVGPLFEVLQKYGGAAVASELDQLVNQWKYYGTAALAQLPDGSGVSALIQIAQGTSSGRLNALEMLAQLSLQNPDARAVLLDQTRANKISPNLWPYLISGLTGDEYHYLNSELDDTLSRVTSSDVKTTHVRSGNQHLYSAPSAASLTPDGIIQRLAFLDELRSLTSDPSALKAMQQAQDVLSKRWPRTVAAGR